MLKQHVIIVAIITIIIILFAKDLQILQVC